VACDGSASYQRPLYVSTRGKNKTYDNDSSDDDGDDDDNEEEKHIVPIRVDPDDSAATVMQKYEASGLWQRRARAENLHPNVVAPHRS
jgi:hypothetical protein